MTIEQMNNKAYAMYKDLGKLDMRVFNHFHDWLDDVVSQLGYLEDYPEDDNTELAKKYFECIKSIHKSALEMDKAYKIWKSC